MKESKLKSILHFYIYLYPFTKFLNTTYMPGPGVVHRAKAQPVVIIVVIHKTLNNHSKNTIIQISFSLNAYILYPITFHYKHNYKAFSNSKDIIYL